MVYGDDDPYAPAHCSQVCKRKLRTPLTIIPHGGHMNAESGPQDLDMFMSFLYLLLCSILLICLSYFTS
ncbi:MAG: alpha/beta hydrolase [Endomicrobium sp.]|nr:alpha/beta hydrolase [Endomicrobium sp.]